MRRHRAALTDRECAGHQLERPPRCLPLHL